MENILTKNSKYQKIRVLEPVRVTLPGYSKYTKFACDDTKHTQALHKARFLITTESKPESRYSRDMALTLSQNHGSCTIKTLSFHRATTTTHCITAQS